MRLTLTFVTLLASLGAASAFVMPRSADDEPIARRMTNGERLARGYPPNAPEMKRWDNDHYNKKPAVSPSPSPIYKGATPPSNWNHNKGATPPPNWNDNKGATPAPGWSGNKGATPPPNWKDNSPSGWKGATPPKPSGTWKGTTPPNYKQDNDDKVHWENDHGHKRGGYDNYDPYYYPKTRPSPRPRPYRS